MSDRSRTNRRLLLWGLGAAGITVGVPVLVWKRSSGGRARTVEVNASVSIRRSPKEVYEYWRDFEKLPTFMRHLQSVDVHGDGRSTWTANAPVKKRSAGRPR